MRLALEWRNKHQPSDRWSQLYGGGFASATAFLSQSREVQRQERLVAEHDARWRAVCSCVPLVTMALAFMLLQILAEPVVVSWMQEARPGRGFWGPLASHLLTGMPAAIGYMLLAPFVRQRFPSWEARWQARKPSPGGAPQAQAVPAKAAEPAVDVASSSPTWPATGSARGSPLAVSLRAG